ncbi:MAG: flagellar basal-body rod protein FlgG [Phycisphaerae bacterium]|nr:flagellar basal-body rod protein FlgG [Phycisphaerae bacterium]
MSSTALNTSATGLSALTTQLEVIANNLANVDTDAFKASRANFADLLYMQKQQPGVENVAGQYNPTGISVGLGTRVSGIQANFQQGSPRTTGMPFDLCIQGDGFFQIETNDDIGGGIAYTRLGTFIPNNEGQLVLANGQGLPLIPDIVIPQDAIGVTVTLDGVVTATFQTGQQTQLGTLVLARFVNPSGLLPVGNNLYIETQASGDPILNEPLEDGTGSVLQGALESSNVDPVTQLVQLIQTQRAFEMNSQVIQAANSNWQTINSLWRY